jgi:hypothetical protein
LEKEREFKPTAWRESNLPAVLFGSCGAYIAPMSKRKREYKFQVIRLRSSGQYLGTVRAPNPKAAKEAAVTAFRLRPVDQSRIIVLRRET